jgi:hypothetical protein
MRWSPQSYRETVTSSHRSPVESEEGIPEPIQYLSEHKDGKQTTFLYKARLEQEYTGYVTMMCVTARGQPGCLCAVFAVLVLRKSVHNHAGVSPAQLSALYGAIPP